jgi:hypothetical protein
MRILDRPADSAAVPKMAASGQKDATRDQMLDPDAEQRVASEQNR